MKGEEIIKIKIPRNRLLTIGIIGLLILAVIITVVVVNTSKSEEKVAQIHIETALRKIEKRSDLSTCESIYDGIAIAYNSEDPQKVDYYVAYKATVKAGFDFSKVKIVLDRDTKVITATIPEIKITDRNVDITSLDYIFQNKKANASTVSSDAYKLCEEDLEIESKSDFAIIEQARKKAGKTIEGFLKPFVDQLSETYKLQIEFGGAL